MTIDFIYIAVRVIISTTVFAYFPFKSLISRYRFNKKMTAILVSILITATSIITIMFLTPDTLLSDYWLFGICLWVSLAVVIVWLTVRINFLEVLFLVLVALNLYVNVAAIAKIAASEMNFNLSRNSTYAIMTILVTILYIPLLRFLFLKLYAQVIALNISAFFWKFIWMIPALTYMIFYVKIIEDYWRYPVHTTSHDVMFSILWSLTTYAFFWVSLQMLIQAYKGIAAKEETKLVMSQLRIQEGQYRNLLENNEKTSRLRHDLRHHLLSINGLVEAGDLGKLKEYLKTLTIQYLSEGETCLCQNHVVDVILQHYAVRARANGISVKIHADILENIEIRDTDLCIVFGNLLENAVEACALLSPGEASLVVKAEMKNKQLIVMISNTYINAVIVQDEVYYSTKHDGSGIGLSSVKKVIEEYRGKLKVAYNGTYFEVYVMLNPKLLP